jgi:acyl-CoA thioester hydrolase
MATAKPDIDAGRKRLASYPFNIDIQLRFGDVDSLGHINNVQIDRLFEESRFRFASEARRRDPEGMLAQARVVAVESRYRYLREVFYPETVTIGVGVLRVGNSSYAIGCGMFQSGVCVALGDTVLVRTENGRSAPLPEEIREALAPYLLPSA